MDGGLVLFVTAYHKGYEYSERTKLIQRFLPREVGELLVYYLWLTLLFWETIQLMVDGVKVLSPFVWGDEQSESREEEKENKGGGSGSGGGGGGGSEGEEDDDSEENDEPGDNIIQGDVMISPAQRVKSNRRPYPQ